MELFVATLHCRVMYLISFSHYFDVFILTTFGSKLVIASISRTYQNT